MTILLTSVMLGLDHSEPFRHLWQTCRCERPSILRIVNGHETPSSASPIRGMRVLAAAYGYGITKNRPFIDGNKRTALVVTETFLNLNGLDLMADDAVCVAVMRAVADGTMKEEKFVCWIRENIALIKPPLNPRLGPGAGP